MRLELRPVSSGDMGFLRGLRNENREWFFDSRELTKQDQLKWFHRYVNDWWDVMFIISIDGTDIGTAALYGIDMNKKEAEVGRIIIAKDHRRKGYARTALKLLIDHGRQLFSIERFRLSFTLENMVAFNLYRKLGFSIIREGDKWHGELQTGDRPPAD